MDALLGVEDTVDGPDRGTAVNGSHRGRGRGGGGAKPVVLQVLVGRRCVGLSTGCLRFLFTKTDMLYFVIYM